MTTETNHRLHGETDIVYVPLWRAARMMTTVKYWPSLTVYGVANAGEHPNTRDFSSHPMVPEGHIALKILWEQRTPDDPIGVPCTFYDEVRNLCP